MFSFLPLPFSRELRHRCGVLSVSLCPWFYLQHVCMREIVPFFLITSSVSPTSLNCPHLSHGPIFFPCSSPNSSNPSSPPSVIHSLTNSHAPSFSATFPAHFGYCGTLSMALDMQKVPWCPKFRLSTGRSLCTVELWQWLACWKFHGAQTSASFSTSILPASLLPLSCPSFSPYSSPVLPITCSPLVLSPISSPPVLC